MIVSVVLRETAAVVAVAVLAAGCGAHAEAPTVQSNREWVANVHGVLDQLPLQVAPRVLLEHPEVELVLKRLGVLAGQDGQLGAEPVLQTIQS